jgi:hypothetical protein
MSGFLGNIIVLFGVMFFLFCAVSTGNSFFRLFKISFEHPGESLIFSFASGTVIISAGLLAAGKAGFFIKNSMLLFTCALAAVSVPGAMYAWRIFRDIPGGIKKIKTPILIIPAVLFLPGFLLTFLNVFIPPVSWDTLAYHYAIPAIYMAAGKISFIPFMFHAGWPENMEIIAGWAMTLYGDIFANGAMFVYALMLLAALYVFGKRVSGRTAGLLAVIIIGSFSVFKTESFNGYVDTGLTFFETAAAFGVFMFTRTKKKSYVAAAAICAGGAASVKILGLFSAVFLPLFVLFAGYINGDRDKKLYFKEAVLLGITALAVASPWYIKSFLDTGNPVWPFAYRIFGGRYWSAELAGYRSAYYSTHGSGKGLLQILTLPVTLVRSANMDGYMGNNMIFLYLMLPFILFSIFRDRNRKQLFLILYSAVFAGFWFMSTQMVRFFFPGLAIITVMCSAQAAKLLEGKDKTLKYITAGLVIYLTLYSYPKDLTGAKFFLGLSDRKTFLEANMGAYRLYERVNSDPDIKGKIILFREIRGYYLQKEYMWGDPANQALVGYKTTGGTIQDLKDNSVKYIIYNNNIYGNAEADGYTDRVHFIMKEIIEKHSVLLYCENGVCLYGVKY